MGFAFEMVVAFRMQTFSKEIDALLAQCDYIYR